MTTTALLDEVRDSAAWVAACARSVEIRRERLPSYAAELTAMSRFQLAIDPRYHYLGQGADTVAFILCLDAINFGSGWFRWLIERPGLGGYFTVAVSLKEWFEEHGPPTADELTAFDAERCARIFGQVEAADPIGELMEHFAGAWRELGRFLLDRFEGDFVSLVAAAGGSAERLVAILRQMTFFDDVAVYEDRPVPLFKRAQLAAVDLALAFSGEGPGRFDDLERLTIFADNQVPQVLRADGVLEYEPSLADRVARGEELARDSSEEVEIRACTVHAVELLKVELEKLGSPLAAWELDQLLWHRGLDLDAGTPPGHRTRTIFY